MDASSAMSLSGSFFCSQNVRGLGVVKSNNVEGSLKFSLIKYFCNNHKFCVKINTLHKT